jgi:hypothetical protein
MTKISQSESFGFSLSLVAALLSGLGGSGTVHAQTYTMLQDSTRPRYYSLDSEVRGRTY